MRADTTRSDRFAFRARITAGSAVAAAVALALHGSLAGAAESGPASADAGALEEIVVSAERRSTALQDTPISIQALSAETMENRGVEDIADVAMFTPNLAITGSRGSGNNSPTFSIRGISGGGGATGERGVALYIDDIFVPRTAGSVFKVFDLERVEVLRGPQGTNFGRNSQGGAIRLITKQPVHEFEAYAKATVGNFDRRDLIGMVNMPTVPVNVTFGGQNMDTLYITSYDRIYSIRTNKIGYQLPSPSAVARQGRGALTGGTVP